MIRPGRNEQAGQTGCDSERAGAQRTGLSGALALLALGALAAVSAPATAAAIYCQGTVNAVSTQADGAVSIETAWHGQAVQVCNVEAAWKNVPAETCRRWHAQLSLALSTRDSMLVYYPSTSAADCAQMGTGSSADAPGFFANQ